MGDKSAIEWTDATWNPIRARNRVTGRLGWHCEPVSEACKFCYAGTMNAWRGTGLAYKPGHRDDVEIFVDETVLLKPLRWTRPRMIFVCSMTDLFAGFVPDAMIDRVFAVMALCPQHTLQVLTKRPDRMRGYVSRMCNRDDLIADAAVSIARSIGGNSESLHRTIMVDVRSPLRNVWLGTSCEDQATADARVPDLLATPASIRFVSAEPLLGPVDFKKWLPGSYECASECGWRSGNPPKLEICHSCGLTSERFGEFCKCGSQDFGHVCPKCESDAVVDHPDTPNLNWIIAGGLSGSRKHPLHPDWVRSIRDQCAAADVAFFFKQWGEWGPGAEFSAEASYRKVYRGELQTLQLLGRPEIKLAVPTRDDDSLGPALTLERFGKKLAGRLLDGLTHDGMPEVRS